MAEEDFIKDSRLNYQMLLQTLTDITDSSYGHLHPLLSQI